MDMIAKFLKVKCISDRLKDRIKTNLKKVIHRPDSKVKPANEYFDCFRGTQDGVLTLYLIWDALDTLKLHHTMYLFRNETGFDPTKINNPHILKHMHELVRDRRHCDIIMAHTMQWYTRDYTPRMDKCCQRQLLEELVKEAGLEKFHESSMEEGDEEKLKIDKKNLVDGNASRVTVSIHMDDKDKEPQVIEIPRNTTAKNIQIYLKGKSSSAPTSQPTQKISMELKNCKEDSDSSSDASGASSKTEKKGQETRSKSRSPNRRRSTVKPKEPLGDSNDENGLRKGFRRSLSPSRSSLSLKGGSRKDSVSTNCTEGTDSYSYIHNPELHSLFLEELRKVRERKKLCKREAEEEQEPKCRTSKGDHCPKVDTSKGEMILTACLVKREAPLSPPSPNSCTHCHYTPIPKTSPVKPPLVPHLVTQCKQLRVSMCGNPVLCQPPQPRQCSPENNCFQELVRKGTEDLYKSSENTRRFDDAMKRDCELDLLRSDLEEKECKSVFIEETDRANQCGNSCNQGGQCGQLLSPKPKQCNVPPLFKPQVNHSHTDGQCNQMHSMRNVHPGIGGDGCDTGYQPDVLSEFE